MQFLTARGGGGRKKKKARRGCGGGGGGGDAGGGHTQELPSSEEPDATAKKHLCAIISLKIMECECWPVSNVPSMFFNLSIQRELPSEVRRESVVSSWIPASLIISAGWDYFPSVWGDIRRRGKV